MPSCRALASLALLLAESIAGLEGRIYRHHPRENIMLVPHFHCIFFSDIFTLGIKHYHVMHMNFSLTQPRAGSKFYRTGLTVRLLLSTVRSPPSPPSLPLFPDGRQLYEISFEIPSHRIYFPPSTLHQGHRSSTVPQRSTVQQCYVLVATVLYSTQ